MSITSLLPEALHPLLGRVPALGPGEPNEAARQTLVGLTINDIVPTVRDKSFAEACLAGLWLLHDFLDESHTISQEIHTPTGSFWHGIMHRREPDAWNSKYWFQKVGNHPVIASLVKQAPQIGYNYTTPAQFVDFCEESRDTNTANEELAKRVQFLEWELLFEHCLRSALKLA